MVRYSNSIDSNFSLKVLNKCLKNFCIMNKSKTLFAKLVLRIIDLFFKVESKLS